MDPLTITAASGLRARLESLDLLANNLANSATAGYKADRESYSLYLSEDALLAGDAGFARPLGSSPLVEKRWSDLSQGHLESTGSQTDLALDGKGFFVVQGPHGPMLTRRGSFQVDPSGRLLTKEGYEFETVEPRRIRAERDVPVLVEEDGQVLQRGVPLGRLKVVDATQDSPLAKRDGVFFTLDRITYDRLAASSAQVRQGQLEASNVGAAESAVRLIDILRQFESLQRAIQIGGEMSRRAVEEVARVSA
jgi:flagellar basal body rod protein FlgG